MGSEDEACDRQKTKVNGASLKWAIGNLTKRINQLESGEVGKIAIGASQGRPVLDGQSGQVGVRDWSIKIDVKQIRL
jgi:hypothetical protein